MLVAQGYFTEAKTMKNVVNQILETRARLTELITAVVEDEQQSVANKAAAIIHGESSSNRKRALVERLLKSNGLVPLDAYVHVKNGALMASQIGVRTSKEPHYVAAVIGNEFRVVKFDPDEARQIGKCCHGTIHKSDAYRATVTSISRPVYCEAVT